MKMKDDNKDFRLQVASLSLNDLIFIKKLGEGQFGHVFLVKNALGEEYYALKAISRNQIVEQSLERHTLQEKEVLELVNFPFIMKLYRTFKDINFVYFLLSFVRGMELFDVIRQMGMFETNSRLVKQRRESVLHRLYDSCTRVLAFQEDSLQRHKA